MKKAQGDFSRGSVSGNILRLALPMIAAEFVHVLYNIVDRAFIGRIPDVGTLALSGIGISFPLVTLIGAFAHLCGSGGAPLFSISRGSGDQEQARRTMTTAFTLLLLFGMTLTVLLFLLAPWLLRLLGGDDETLPMALSYFRIYVLGSIPVLISLGMNPYINAQGYPALGTVTIVVGAALNIILDPLFIFVLDMGIAGAALATVIAQTASAVWVLLVLTGKKLPIRLARPHLDRACAVSIMKLGVTGFTFKITNSVTQAVVNIMLKCWGGTLSTLYITAMSLINSVREIVSLPCSGITSGAQPVVSFNYGAKSNDRVSQGIRFVLFSTLLINVVMWLPIMFFPDLIVLIFNDSDPELLSVTVPCARVFFAAFPFMALQSTGQSTFVALNKPKQALFFSMFRKLILVTPLTVLLPSLGFGISGVFWAEAFSQWIGASACFITMSLTVWRKLRSSNQHA